MPRRVLVAGCGDVGTRLARDLAARGDTVYGLRRDPGRLPPGVLPLPLDLVSPAPWPPLPAAIDALVFCAAPDRRDAAAYRALFVHAPLRLLQALDGPPARVLFVSSTAVYGEDAGEWVDEATPPRPRAFNGELLLEAEGALRARRPDAVVLRLAGLYGPGRERLRQRALAGDRGSPRWLNRIHVDAAAAALRHLLDVASPAPLYLGAETPVREDELLARLRGEPRGEAAAGPATGRRVAADRLRASGWRPGPPGGGEPECSPLLPQRGLL
jgi:nucleoside-diphosphate-sugar epimerase